MSNDRPQHRTRDRHTAPLPPIHLVDLGGTPPWYHPPSYQQESALRSTLSIRDETPPRADSVFEPSAIPKPTTTQSDDTAQIRPYTADSEYAPFTPHYTLSSSSNPTDQPSSPGRSHVQDSANADPRSLPPDSHPFTHSHAPSTTQFLLDFHEIDESQVETLDPDDKRVYHIGPTGRSLAYSGRFTQKPPPETAEDAIGSLQWHRDTIFRFTHAPDRERELRALLRQGLSLYLERTPPSPTEATCYLPGCLSRSVTIPPSTYYLAFRTNSPERPHTKADLCYCLKCLEWLWKGSYHRELLPQPGILAEEEEEDEEEEEEEEESDPERTIRDDLTMQRDRLAAECASYEALLTARPQPHADRGPLTHDPSPETTPLMNPIPQYDGRPSTPPNNNTTPFPPPQNSQDHHHPPGPASLLSSRWAFTSPLSSSSSPPTTIPPPSPQPSHPPSHSSPSSTTSTGEWRFPPTRLQHIHPTIKPGTSRSLTARHKAAVWLWKAASLTQLRWERHLRRSRLRRRRQDAGEDATSESSHGGGGGEEDDDEEGEEEEGKEEEEEEEEKEEEDVRGFDDGDANVDDEDDEDDVRCWERMTGVRKKECYGNDLSDVLWLLGERAAPVEG